jgi:hypothetical protein
MLPAMDPKELGKHFQIAVAMNLSKLPQLKGKGAVTDREELDRAVRYFADGVLERLKLSGITLTHQQSPNVAIPFGLPRK